MAKIVWIASYPRSGNTWVRFLLATLLYGPVQSSVALNKTIPDIHRGVAGGLLHGSRKLLMKTHWRYEPGLPLREDTIGVIYIVRHPIDVMISNLDYNIVRSPQFATATPEMRRDAGRRWIDEYIAHGGRELWRQQGFGSWSENVASWTEAPLPYPRLILRYEDLKAAPEANLATMAAFLGATTDAARIADAVARSSFDAMRAIEEQEIRARDSNGIFYSPALEPGIAAGHRFIRRGESGGQETELTPVQREAAHARFGAAMARFGYAGETAQAAPAAD